MNKFEEYRRQADLCIRKSRTADTLEMRVSWLRLASKWLGLIPPDETNAATAAVATAVTEDHKAHAAPGTDIPAIKAAAK